MKHVYYALAFFVSAFSLYGPTSLGQTVTAPADDNRPLAAITFANLKSLKTKCKSSQSDPVSINPGETVTIQLQFAPTLATTAVIIQPLDGGVISAVDQDNVVGEDGTASAQFQAGTQPGLYRLLVNADGTLSTLQFWVADTKNSRVNPPVLKP